MAMAEEEEGEGEEVRWVVRDGSSEDEVHPATNVLKQDRYRLWQTEAPTEDAWLIIEPRPPTVFHKVEIVNAGSALVEIHGLREDADGNSDEDFELLLSAQQVMSVKDLISKSNRNRDFVYDIDATHKLSPVAAQHRWRRIRVNCRQPFGTAEHRACIGLAYISFTSCKSKADKQLKTQNSINDKEKPAATTTKRKLPSWASPDEPEAARTKPSKKLKESVHQEDEDVSESDLKPVKPRTEAKKDMSPDAQETEKSRSNRPKVPEAQTSKDETKAQASSRGQTRRSPERDNMGAKQKSRKSHMKSPSPDAKEVKEQKRARGDKEGVIRVGLPATQHSYDDARPKHVTEEKAAMKSSKDGDTGIDPAPRVGRRGDGPSTKTDGVAQGVSSHGKAHSSGEEKDRPDRGNVKDVRGASSGRKKSPEQDFTKLLEGVVFAISGIQNPDRAQLRDKGLEIGARYRTDWTSDCTLLVCAFMDTPKFKQVKADGGTIVAKDWILECHKQRKLVDIDRFLMNKGKPWRPPGRPSEQADVVVDKTNETLVRKKVSCGSAAEIRQWVQDDLASTISWLQQQDAKPEPEELESTAAQGILVCLEDAVKCLQENQGVSSVVENWGFLPKAVKELAAMEEGKEGYVKGTRSGLLGEAERLKGIYTENLKHVTAQSRGPTNGTEQKKGGSEEDDVDDDATEVMSDVDSQETVDYNSDDTIVMDPKTIQECTEKLIARFTAHK